MNSNSWAALIPAYNAAAMISSVVKGVSTFLPTERILVVDDGSSDGTAEAVKETGACLLSRGENGGKGLALRDGFKRLLEWEPEWIICLDADGQHDPAAIPGFRKAAESGKFDLIVGNRIGNIQGMPFIRRFSNRFSSYLVSLRTGMKLPDVQCGYRAIRTEVLRMMHLKSRQYEIEAEMILQAWRLHCRIGWVPIPTVYQGEPSHIKKFPETIRFLKLLGRSFYE